MLLTRKNDRLDSRSTEELTIDELIRLKATLESSETIERYERMNRPKRGGVVFGFVPLLLLYLFMECRKTTYRGVVRNLNAHECECLGFPRSGNGRCRRPSAATLNHFVNHVLAHLDEEIGIEVAREVLNECGLLFTIDSTPLQASRYNFNADFNVHYNIRMDKAHIIMAGGFPVAMIQSGGNAGDSPFCIPLVRRACGISHGLMINEFHADGAYDAFRTYAHVYIATGAVMRCNQGTDAVCSGVDDERIRKEYNGMWKTDGYDPHMKNDVDFMLRFLYRHGNVELVGRYIRDRSMELDEKEGKTNARHVCETVHRAMKRWIEFSIFRLVKGTKTIRTRCRFLCLQLLATLFKGYTEG